MPTATQFQIDSMKANLEFYKATWQRLVPNPTPAQAAQRDATIMIIQGMIDAVTLARD